jgi:hypothetical protein
MVAFALERRIGYGEDEDELDHTLVGVHQATSINGVLLDPIKRPGSESQCRFDLHEAALRRIRQAHRRFNVRWQVFPHLLFELIYRVEYSVKT